MKRSKDRKDGNREANLVTMFDKIVLRAGLNPWPMPGNNLRGSLVTDLYNGKYPEIGIHTIAKWIGHSSEIALKHYTRVRDEDFDKVRSKSAQFETKNIYEREYSNTHCAKTCAFSEVENALTVDVSKGKGKKSIAQNRAQYTPEMGCKKL